MKMTSKLTNKYILVCQSPHKEIADVEVWSEDNCPNNSFLIHNKDITIKTIKDWKKKNPHCKQHLGYMQLTRAQAIELLLSNYKQKEVEYLLDNRKGYWAEQNITWVIKAKSDVLSTYKT